MGAVSAWFQTNRGYPIAHEPTILPRRNVWAVVKPAWKHEPASEHLRGVHPDGHRIPCVLRQFELNGLTGFTLDDGDALFHLLAADQVPNGEPNKVTSSQFAVDGDVEKRQVTQIAGQFQSCTDCPNLFRQERSLLTDDAAFVPGPAFWRRCRKLNSRHDLPSNPPSRPRHQHRTDGRFYHSNQMSVYGKPPISDLLRRQSAGKSPMQPVGSDALQIVSSQLSGWKRKFRWKSSQKAAAFAELSDMP